MSKKNERKKRILRIFTAISAIAFLGSAGFGFIRMLTNPAQSTQVSTQAEDLTQQLQAQARGYEMVLQREPENQIALQGLVEIRLQMKDFEGTIEPLKTLIRLNPEQEQYKTLLATVKQQVEQQGDGKKDDKATSN
jgi:cytochrome c-type biogenesis protein CcmH/NrfG